MQASFSVASNQLVDITEASWGVFCVKKPVQVAAESLSYTDQCCPTFVMMRATLVTCYKTANHIHPSPNCSTLVMVHCKKFVNGINRKFQAYISKSHIHYTRTQQCWRLLRETFASIFSETAGTEWKQRLVLFVPGTEWPLTSVSLSTVREAESCVSFDLMLVVAELAWKRRRYRVGLTIERWWGSTAGRALPRNNLAQVIYSYVPLLSPSCMIWYGPKGGDTLWLGW